MVEEVADFGSPVSFFCRIVNTHFLASVVLQAQRYGELLFVVVAVAPGKLGGLLAAVVELNLVVLGESDTAVHLLALANGAAAGVRNPGLGDVHLLARVLVTGRDGPGGAVGDV